MNYKPTIPTVRTEAQKAAFYGAIGFTKKKGPPKKKKISESDRVTKKVIDILDEQCLLKYVNGDDPLDQMSMEEFNEAMK